MIAALVFGVYIFGAGTTFYFCSTYDLCLEKSTCKHCGASMVVRNYKAVCPGCKANWKWDEAKFYSWNPNSDDNSGFLTFITSIGWPVTTPFLALLRKSQRVRNENIRRRLELEASEKEIEKLLSEGRK